MPAAASPNISVSFSREEIAALLALIDAGVKALGRPAARACAVLDDKINTAVRAAQGPKANGQHTNQEADIEAP
jgi:hypothetical protein